jgi:hypothetical protein
MDAVAQMTSRERAQLFEAAEARHVPRISASVIEKDFWVCWTLRRLYEVLQFRPRPIFKGGTSLSKVFNAVDRFSEDVDLSLSRRDLGYADERDPERVGITKQERRRRIDDLTTQCQKIVRERLIPGLRQDFSAVLGSSGWGVTLDVSDPLTVIFSYPPSHLTNALSYIRPAIRLEMGARSDDWPMIAAEIKPYAADVFPGMFTFPTCKVDALDAVRTFWEKATILHAEYHRPPHKPSRERLSRHYYDLYCLSNQEIGDQALKRNDLLKRVVQHKRHFFAQAWASYDTAQPGSFHLVPMGSRIDELQKDYAAMRPMIFGEFPSWDNIQRRLRQLESQINDIFKGNKFS